MATNLCWILEGVAHNRSVNNQLDRLAFGLDNGAIDPTKLMGQKCFRDFLIYVHNLGRRGLERSFVDHYPGTYPFNQLQQDVKVESKSISHEDSGSDEDNRDQLAFLSGLVGRAAGLAHVATPIVFEESKLPLDLASLIGQYNTTCETITGGGKYCGMGSDDSFIYKLPSTSGNSSGTTDATFVDCQSECTGDLCSDWLSSLLTNRPKIVDIQQATALRQSNSSNSSNGPTSLRFPIVYCRFYIPGTNWDAFLNTGSLTMLNGISVTNPAFLRAGCRILNSSRQSNLVVEIGLGFKSSDSLVQGMLQTFSKFTYPSKVLVNFPELSRGNYLTNSSGWKVVQGPYGNFTLTISLPISNSQTRKESMDKINQAEVQRTKEL